eukprot:11399809-Alexandrium_andersonii.AAC.1
MGFVETWCSFELRGPDHEVDRLPKIQGKDGRRPLRVARAASGGTTRMYLVPLAVHLPDDSPNGFSGQGGKGHDSALHHP